MALYADGLRPLFRKHHEWIGADPIYPVVSAQVYEYWKDRFCEAPGSLSGQPLHDSVPATCAALKVLDGKEPKHRLWEAADEQLAEVGQT